MEMSLRSKLTLLILTLLVSVVCIAQEGAPTDDAQDFTAPSIVQFNKNCQQAVCPGVEIVTGNDDESNSRALGYVQQALDQGPAAQIIIVVPTDSDGHLTQNALNTEGQLLSDEMAPVIPQAAQMSANHAVKKVEGLLEANKAKPALQVQVPSKDSAGSSTSLARDKERIVYTIIRAGIGLTLNTTVAINVGIDPILAMAVLGTLGASYYGTMQYYSTAYYHWASHRGLKPDRGNEKASNLEILTKRASVSFLYLTTFSVLSDLAIGELPALGLPEVSKVFLSAGKSAGATHFWFKLQDLLTNSANLTQAQEKSIARIQFAIGLAGNIIMLMDLLEFQVANYAWGGILASGLGTYKVLQLWQSKEEEPGLTSRVKAWWRRHVDGCKQSILFLNPLAFIKNLYK